MLPTVAIAGTLVGAMFVPDVTARGRRIRAQVRANRQQARYRSLRRFDTRVINSLLDEGRIDRTRARVMHAHSRTIRATEATGR